MYGAVTPVLIDKWRPPTADAVWVGGRVYLKQILQAFPLSPLPLPGFYFFTLLFSSHRSPPSERLEQAKCSCFWGLSRVHPRNFTFNKKIIPFEFPDKKIAGSKPWERSVANKSLNCSPCDLNLRHPSIHTFTCVHFLLCFESKIQL